MPKVRHYGRYVGEVCLINMPGGGPYRAEVVELDKMDNNGCFVEWLEGPNKGLKQHAVCEWLKPAPRSKKSNNVDVKKAELSALLFVVEARMRGADEPRDFVVIAKQLREASRKAERLSK